MPENEQQDTNITVASSSTKRRTIVKGAAWSMPIIAAAVAAPAASASGDPAGTTCPSMGLWWGHAAEFEAKNLNGTRWAAPSTGTTQVGLGNPTNGGYPAFAMSAPEPVEIHVLALSYTYTMAFEVNFTSIPRDWALSSSSFNNQIWTYVFTYTKSGTSATLTSNNAPGTSIVPAIYASGDIVRSSIPVGTDTESTRFKTFSATIDVTYLPIFLESRGCTSAVGDDGAGRVRSYSYSGVMSKR